MANPKTGNFALEILRFRAAQEEAERKKEIEVAEEMRYRAVLDMQRYSSIPGAMIPSAYMPMAFMGSWDIEEAPKKQHDALKEKIGKLTGATSALLPKPGPDYVATLTGWRGWAIKDEKLTALGDGSKIWKPKKAEKAKCTIGGSHAAPQKSCKCGYWSFRSMDLLMEALRSYTNSVIVVGSVEIWGRVIECQNGYRLEFAYPKELWLLKDGLEHLSWTYGVPIRKIP